MCLCRHPVRCCLTQMGHADWIWYRDVDAEAVRDALLLTNIKHESPPDVTPVRRVTTWSCFKTFTIHETKRLLCFRPLRQRQKQSLPAVRPSQVGRLRSERRSPIGRPDRPYRCFKCASFETRLSKATLILKGEQLMEGYKGRWSELRREGERIN